MDRAAAESFYRNYLQRCNERRFDELHEFVADAVEVNGEPYGLARYVAGLRDVVDTFPDFHWEVREILVDGDRLAVRLEDHGTTLAGRRVWTREFAMYDVSGGRINSVWGDLDHRRL